MNAPETSTPAPSAAALSGTPPTDPDRGRRPERLALPRFARLPELPRAARPADRTPGWEDGDPEC
ncbi:MAG TPA: hypothetical protein VF263_12300 [Longimicrobiaceae bacterium]